MSLPRIGPRVPFARMSLPRSTERYYDSAPVPLCQEDAHFRLSPWEGTLSKKKKEAPSVLGRGLLSKGSGAIPSPDRDNDTASASACQEGPLEFSPLGI